MTTNMNKFVLAFLSVALLSGCEGFVGGPYSRPDTQQYTKDGSTEYVSGTESFESGIIKAFPDIPIPANHKVDLYRSVIFTSPNNTMGKITLVGSGDVDSIYRFFEGSMTTNGWNLVNAFQSSTSSMYFAKPGKFVAIIIEMDGRGSSKVSINVGPE